MERIQEFVGAFSDAVPSLAHVTDTEPGGPAHASLVDEQRLRRILAIMLDEEEFLGPHGIRAISRRHLEQPCVFDWGGQATRSPTFRPSRTPACSAATPTGAAPSGFQ